jgi:hypothetical protein
MRGFLNTFLEELRLFKSNVRLTRLLKEIFREVEAFLN